MTTKIVPDNEVIYLTPEQPIYPSGTRVCTGNGERIGAAQ